MTKQEYIDHIVALYRVANASDAPDSADHVDWLPVDACTTHCQPLDAIVHAMGLSNIFGDCLIEGELLADHLDNLA